MGSPSDKKIATISIVAFQTRFVALAPILKMVVRRKMGRTEAATQISPGVEASESFSSWRCRKF